MQQSISAIIHNNLFILSKNTNRIKIISKEIGQEALNYISAYTDINNPGTFYISQGNEHEIIDSFKTKFKSLIDLNPINCLNRSNQYIKSINRKLAFDGYFIGRITVYKSHKISQSENNSSLIRRFMDISGFLYMKLDHKFHDFRKKNIPAKPINFRTKMNLFGRLYYSGFEIVSEKRIGAFIYFIAKKVSVPSNAPSPSSSPLIKLNRIGKNGKIITIYKFRTMYPYSEYLQNYIYRNNNLDDDGKFKDDYRISRVGSVMRKYWIDELPMLFNLLKGDVKFFGVRPLSSQYYSLYTEEMKELRIRFKPGLIPPYYVDLPNNFEEILNSEKRYLLDYQKSPYLTDIKYLIKALFNIIIKSRRSK